MELTVLGCSGSYGAPGGGACSGYLVRVGRHRRSGSTAATARSGTCRSTSRPRTSPRSCSRTATPTTASTSTGCTCCLRYGLEREDLPGVRARRAREVPAVARVATGATPSTGARSATATRATVGDIDAAVLAHRPPAAHVRGRGARRRQAPDLHRRHRPRLDASARSARRRPRAVGGHVPRTTTVPRRSTCRRSRPARRRARPAPQRLMLTHLWPHDRPERGRRGGLRGVRRRRHPRRAATSSPTI